MSTTASPVTAIQNQFHLSLNVGNLEKSIRFFELLFGQAAAKCRPDYAKFEVSDPPLVLSLEPSSPPGRGALNHLGIRFPDASHLVAAQRRLEEGGIRTRREDGVECCYAKQTKFWVPDPDGNLWEFYTLEGDIAHRGAGQSIEAMVGAELLERPELADASPCCRQPEPVSLAPGLRNDLPVVVATETWDHFLGMPFTPPARPCETIRLRGSFNGPGAIENGKAWMAVAVSRLASDGRITVHNLTAESPVEGNTLDLPGPAAYVKEVPTREELLGWLVDAGARDIQIEILRSQPCFTRNGVELRETLINAVGPKDSGGAAESQESLFDVIYRGPFAEIVDDDGHRYRRGERVTVDRDRAAILTGTPWQDFFTVCDAEPSACGTHS